MPLPEETPHSYDGTRLLPCSEALRHYGLPYTYVPDRGLTLNRIAGFDTLILPEINCLSGTQAGALEAYWRQGGNLIILGDLGSFDETGAARETSCLESVWGIKTDGEGGPLRELALLAPWIEQDMPPCDLHAARHYAEGALHPLKALRFSLDVSAPQGAEVLAEFTPTCRGNATGKPALLKLPARNDCGEVFFFAGFPSRTVPNSRYGTTVRNQAHWLLPVIIRSLSPQAPLAVEGWPPKVPLEAARPMDIRSYSTYEFFPMLGENHSIAIVASYFRQPAEFGLTAKIPEGRDLAAVSELVQGKEVAYGREGDIIRLQTAMAEEDALRIFVFEWN